MPKEKLPIKFFAKREIDNLRVEAGGDETLPKWVKDQEELSIWSANLVSRFNEFRKIVAEKERQHSFIPLVVKAKISDSAIAKSHRREVCSMFRVGKSNNILGLADNDELLIRINNIEDTEKIVRKIQDVDKFAHALSCVESVDEYYPTITREKVGDVADYKVKLIDFQDYELNNSIQRYFENNIIRLGYTIKKTEYAHNYTVFNLKNISLDKLIDLENEEIFEAVFSIEPMPKYRVVLDLFTEENKVEILHPKKGKKYITVGILDTGIKDIPHLKPWLADEKWTAYPENYQDKSHGTFVSGITIYGDYLEGSDWVGTLGCKLLDANVFPDTSKEELGEDELIRNVQEAIKTYYKDIKVWNLSLSVARQVSENSFSDFAIALDELQDKYDVLICKSTGNCTNFVTGRPKGKIFEGADSVRSLVVGSIAHKKDIVDIAEIDNPSPFTRIGRGPSFIIKPEVVHYGGNAGVNKNGSISTSGIKSFDVDGFVSTSVGTSFSTPRVTAIAGGIYQEMDEEFDPLLIKSLIIHSATYSEMLQVPHAERVNQIGFGRPKGIRDILYNSPNEVTLILRDELFKGEYMDVMDFPMPDCLIQNGFYTGQIIVTLVYNPILEPSQRAEYCQSNIDIKMGTYDTKVDRDTTRRNILNPIGRDGSKNLLIGNCYSKKKMKNNFDDFALKERLLIQYADKFYPVKKYAVDLSEVTDANKIKYLTKDKKWYLLMKGLFREHIELKASIESINLSQEFCLIVTLRDPSGKNLVYDETTHKLNHYNFWHNNVKLHGDIELHV